MGGIGGLLFGTILTKTPIFIGPDSCVFALTASFISFFFVNWSKIKKLSQGSSSIFCFLLIFVFMIIFMGIGSNIWFRVGGLINGFILGISFSREIDDGTDQRSSSYNEQQKGCKKYMKTKYFFGALYVILNLTLLFIVLF